MSRSISLALACAALGCAPVNLTTRLSSNDAATEREIEDRTLLKAPRCSLRVGLLFPGLGALCANRTSEGVALAALGVAELSTGIAAGASSSFSNPSATLPLLAFADLYTASAFDQVLSVQRAMHVPFVPPERLSEVLVAPFSPDVIKRPLVIGMTIGMLALALGYQRLVDGPYQTRDAGTRPVVFGKTLNSSAGYPLGLGVGAGLFTHVAAAEELAFRGTLQSGLARSYGETEGLVLGSLIFGGFHATNALFLPEGERLDYIAKAVPFITLVGVALSVVYRESGYSLGPPAAVHFWYDFLLSAVDFVLHPKNSNLAFVRAF